jgi:hypothetical protein
LKKEIPVRFLGFEGGTIKDGMMGEAYKWLVANEAELRSSAPEGTEYLGVYAPVFISDKNPGDVCFVYAVDSYGALDRQAASSDSRFGELFDEWSGFRHPLTVHEHAYEHGEPDADGSTDPDAGAQVVGRSSYRCSNARAEDG